MSITPVPIELDRLRHLKYTTNAIVDLELVMKSPFTDIAMAQAGLKTARAMLWAGLKWEDKTLTIEKVGDLIDVYLEAGGTVDTLFLKILDALVEGRWFTRNPKPEEGGEKNVQL